MATKKEIQEVELIFRKKIQILTEIAGDFALDRVASEEGDKAELDDKIEGIFWEIDSLVDMREDIINALSKKGK